MANLKKKLPHNVGDEFFVDSTCINCDTCRQLAPETFDDDGHYSYVKCQPSTAASQRKAWQALLSCPTGSIGTTGPNQSRQIMADFPLLLEGGVYYAGFNSPKSYGGSSYFIQHEDGNWLVDSPKYLRVIVESFEKLGGIKYIFLTHQDDVAETDKFAQHFGSQRIIHEADKEAQPESEIIIKGNEPVQLFADFTIIPTPGHTRGHCVLLYKNKYLFSGDHLKWSRTEKRLAASKKVCWYSWTEQIRSMAKLQPYRFEWVLPGHGQRVKLDANVINQQLIELVNRMKTT